MGLFAEVNSPQECGYCGKMTNHWQTKSVDDLYLQTVTPEEIGNGEFYGTCTHCDRWNSFTVTPGSVVITRKKP